jgi:uroporphyrinogen III methyltransferase/synthase
MNRRTPKPGRNVNSSPLANRPLAGLRVMVTRPENPHDPLVEQLCHLGTDVVLQPAIRITPPDDWGPVDAALARLDTFDWLVFSSANGVRFLLERIHENASGALSHVKLAAIGPGTADELAQYGLHADLVPGQYRAEALADSLAKGAAGQRFLLARASRGREVLAEQLLAAGGTVEQVIVYASTDVDRPDPNVAAELHTGKIDWITVTSSAIAGSLVRLFGDDLRRAKLASISPITSEALRELGHAPTVEATEYTMAGLVQAICVGYASA